MKTDRLVLDSNVLISSALSRLGKPAQIMELIRQSDRVLLFSVETLNELTTRLARPKFDRYVTDEERKAFVEDAIRWSEIITITGVAQGCRDPDDDKFLELAVVGGADCLVSSDKKHVLPMHPFQGIPILSPADFMKAVETSDDQE